MPERRGREHHFERLADSLREEIGAILEGELGDPRIGLVTVSEVKLTPDGRVAHVWVETEEDENLARETMQGLESARGYIRKEVMERLRLRHAPELVFELDRSRQYGDRIDQLLRRIERKNRQ